MERRRSVRVEVNLPCRVRIRRNPRQMGLRGITMNISRGGAAIQCMGGIPSDQFPAVGEKVTVDIALPANPAVERRCLCGQATVVRVDDAEGYSLVVRFDHLHFGRWPEPRLELPHFIEAAEQIVM